ncbi:MAG TPA: hypothetical protein VKT75_12895 [Acidobacteriaceae bacterium]|nr:hypothetical protein [Acidobacteriaceae bacterium]
MTTKALLDKLIEIERALQRGQLAEVHVLVLESEDMVLQIEREMLRLQAENIRRRYA